MFNSKSTGKFKSDGWDGAVKRAQEQLVEAQNKVEQLKAAIRTFEQNARELVPFPGEGPVSK